MQIAQFEVHAAIEEKHWWFRARRTIMLSLVASVLPPSKEKAVVEVGCGTGGITAAFNAFYSCTGIDPIPEAIAFAHRKFPGIAYRQGYAPDDIPDLMAQADLVLLIDVLEHVEDDIPFVHKLLASMKPGAFFLAIAPADMRLWSEHDKGFEHYRRYDLERFAQTWEGSPVKVRLLSYCNARLHPVVRLARIIAKLRGKSWGPADTDLSVPSPFLNARLEKIFAGERRTLLDALRRGDGKTAYPRGVSAIALLERG